MNIKNSIYIILAGIFWGSMGLFVHVLTDTFGFSSIQGAVIRITTCVVILGIFLLIKDRKLFKVNPKHLPLLAANGLISVLLMTSFYFASVSAGTSMSITAVLVYTAPFIVVLVSCLFMGEKFTVQKVVSLIIAFVGCCLVSLTDTGKSTPLGLLFGVLSGASYALYSILSTLALRRNLHSFTVTFYSFVFASVGCIFIAIFTDMGSVFAAATDIPKLTFAMLGTGLVTAVLPFTLYTAGLSGTSPAKASIMAYIEPIAACVFGYFRGESMTPLMILGIVLTVMAIVFLNIKIPFLSREEK
ncbi:MAG: EamA family transporter [Clostridia bacterium]|nr:EamA family transporter [Clostridia bacterium]